MVDTSYGRRRLFLDFTNYVTNLICNVQGIITCITNSSRMLDMKFMLVEIELN